LYPGGGYTNAFGTVLNKIEIKLFKLDSDNPSMKSRDQFLLANQYYIKVKTDK